MLPRPSADNQLSVGATTPAAPAANTPPPDAAPSTPPWLLGPEAPCPPEQPSAQACPVCLCDLSSGAVGPEALFPWPICQHRMHLGCVAHLVANVRELRCPACRAGWPAWGAAAFQAACQAEQVDPPAPAPDHDTTSRQHRDATAPQPPPSVLAFCCPRILLANPDSPSRDEAWQELPDRHMHWAPVFHRQSNQWAPEWVCLRCNATVTSEHPLLQGLPPDADRPVCPTHGPRCLALDLREGSRGWICSRGAQVLPCRAVRIPLPPANPEPGPAANAPPDADFAWFRRGPPPPGTPPGLTHSWIFVPLLHAAVGRLHPDALQAWETDSHYGALWSRALANLRLAGSVPPASVVHALHILQQLSSEEGRPVPLPEAQLLLNISGGASTLPANASVHLLWAWSFAVQPDGYIPATAQEALLHVFLGEAAASELVQQTSAPPAATSTDAPAPAVHPPQPPAQRPGSASSSSASSSSSSPFAAVGPVPANATPPNEPEQPQAPASDHVPIQPSTVQDTPLAGARLRAAFVSLDAFCATDVLQQPCPTFRSPPKLLRGPLRQAMHLALSHIQSLSAAATSVESERAWKLWLFLPRMLLFRPQAAARIPAAVLRARITAFQGGDWASLLREASAASPPARASVSEPGAEQRADRAVHLARLGELSAARRALLSEPLAPGDQATLQQLRDPDRRLCQPYAPVDPALLSWLPEAPVALPAPCSATCVAPAEVLPPAPQDSQPRSHVCSSTMPTPPKHSAASRSC